MAIGTITVTKTGVLGDLKYAIGTFVGESTYTVGGTTTTVSALSKGFINTAAYMLQVGDPASGNRVSIAATISAALGVTIKLFTASGTELTAVADSGNTYTYFLLGK